MADSGQKMTTNSLQANIRTLQAIVAFAEGESTTFPTLFLETVQGGLLGVDPTTYARGRGLTGKHVDAIRTELRDLLRAIATGQRKDVALALTCRITPTSGRSPRRCKTAREQAADTKTTSVFLV